MLGDLVNVVARYLREQTGNYIYEIRGPALKLLGLYGVQVSAQEEICYVAHLKMPLLHQQAAESYDYDEVVASMCSVDIHSFHCAGPADDRLHHPAFSGWGESGSGHEKDAFRLLTEVHMTEAVIRRMQSWLLLTATNAVIVTFPLRQDVAFFDANKTGQLVNRLTADIQEFKSSFKLVISQVLSENLCCKIINL